MTKRKRNEVEEVKWRGELKIKDMEEEGKNRGRKGERSRKKIKGEGNGRRKWSVEEGRRGKRTENM